MNWCEERYSMTFVKEHEGPEEMMRLSGILTGFLAQESIEANGGGCPLGLVMDEVGYKGDRDGLVETSLVKDVVISGDAVSFVVRDNYSEFNIAKAISDTMKESFRVKVSYSFEEGHSVYNSPEFEHEAHPSIKLAEILKDRIAESLDFLASPGQGLDFRVYVPFNGFVVAGIGPDSNDIRLVREDAGGAEEDSVVTLHVDDIKDSLVLERLIDGVNDNSREISRYQDEGYLLSRGLIPVREEDEHREVDFQKELTAIRMELYGDREPVRSVDSYAPYMEGFEAILVPGNIQAAPTAEEAIDWASRAKGADGAVVDLSEEVAMEIRNGAEPSEALREWDIEPYPEKNTEDKLIITFDGEPMLGFDKIPYEMDSAEGYGEFPTPETLDGWVLSYRDGNTERFCESRSGVNCSKLLRLDEKKAFTGGELKVIIGHLMKSDYNFRMAGEAVRKVNRRSQQQSAYLRFLRAGKGEDVKKHI